MKPERTNVMRLLDAAKAEYVTHEYDAEKYIACDEVAAALGQDIETVFKTLVTVSDKTKEHYVFVIPGGETLDLKKAAKASGAKSIEMIKQRDLQPLTGYIHGGCSPIGMKKSFPTFIDETAELWDTIVFSAGKRGYQVEMSIEELRKVIDFELVDLTV